jgi:hypothetical protein
VALGQSQDSSCDQSRDHLLNFLNHPGFGLFGVLPQVFALAFAAASSRSVDIAVLSLDGVIIPGLLVLRLLLLSKAHAVGPATAGLLLVSLAISTKARLNVAAEFLAVWDGRESFSRHRSGCGSRASSGSDIRPGSGGQACLVKFLAVANIPRYASRRCTFCFRTSRYFL